MRSCAPELRQKASVAVEIVIDLDSIFTSWKVVASPTRFYTRCFVLICILIVVGDEKAIVNIDSNKLINLIKY